MLFTKSLRRKILITKISVNLQSHPSLHHLKQKKWIPATDPVYSSPSPMGTKAGHAPGIAVANGIHLNPAFVTLEQLRLSLWDASWLLHKVVELCLLLIPLAFSASPSHADTQWTLLSGGHSTEVWSPWPCGAHIPRRIPNSRAWSTHSAGIPKKSSVTLGCEPVLLPSSGVWGHTRPWDGGWAAVAASGRNDKQFQSWKNYHSDILPWPGTMTLMRQRAFKDANQKMLLLIFYTHSCG